MIKLLLIPGFFMMSCGATKKNRELVESDSLIVTQPAGKTGSDNIDNKSAYVQLPACIQSKIDSFKLKEAHEMPQKVVAYSYRGKRVYYVVMPCCDFFNEVYDAACNYLGAPDGGFTGKGDGKIPDFFTAAREEKIVWQAGK